MSAINLTTSREVIRNLSNINELFTTINSRLTNFCKRSSITDVLKRPKYASDDTLKNQPPKVFRKKRCS